MIEIEASNPKANYIWTIYKPHNANCPNQHAKCFEVTAEGTKMLNGTLFGTYEELQRKFSDAGLIMLQRSPEDDSSIVESWI